MPEAAPLAECGGNARHATDAEIARLAVAASSTSRSAHPRVIGLLAFGFWTSGHDSGDLPRTVAAHRQIAARIIAAAGAGGNAPAGARLPRPRRLDADRRPRARSRSVARACAAPASSRSRSACPSAGSACSGRVSLAAALPSEAPPHRAAALHRRAGGPRRRAGPRAAAGAPHAASRPPPHRRPPDRDRPDRGRRDEAPHRAARVIRRQAGQTSDRVPRDPRRGRAGGGRRSPPGAWPRRSRTGSSTPCARSPVGTARPASRPRSSAWRAGPTRGRT